MGVGLFPLFDYYESCCCEHSCTVLFQVFCEHDSFLFTPEWSCRVRGQRHASPRVPARRSGRAAGAHRPPARRARGFRPPRLLAGTDRWRSPIVATPAGGTCRPASFHAELSRRGSALLSGHMRCFTCRSCRRCWVQTSRAGVRGDGLCQPVWLSGRCLPPVTRPPLLFQTA